MKDCQEEEAEQSTPSVTARGCGGVNGTLRGVHWQRLDDGIYEKFVHLMKERSNVAERGHLKHRFMAYVVTTALSSHD